MADINALLAAGVGPALQEGTHAGYFSARANRENDQEKRRLASQADIPGAMAGDTGAFGRVAANDPQGAVAISTALSRMDANQRAKAKDTADWVSRASNAVLQADPKDQPAMYERMKAEGLALGHDVSKLGPWDQSTPSMLRYQRGMSQDVLKHDLQMELKKTPPGKNAAAGAGMFDKPSGGGAQIPVPVEPGGAPDKESSLMPGQPAPTQVASYLPPNLQPAPPAAPPVQAAAAPPGVATGENQVTLASQAAPVAEPAPAAPAGPPEGFQAMGHRDAKGTLVPAQINGQPVYRNPQTGEMRLGDAPAVQAAAAPPAEPVPALSSGGTDAQRPGGGLPGPQIAQATPPTAGAPVTRAPVSSAPEGIVYENPDPTLYEVARQGGAPYRDKQGDLRLISRTGDPKVKMLILRPREEKVDKNAGLPLDGDLTKEGPEYEATLPSQTRSMFNNWVEGKDAPSQRMLTTPAGKKLLDEFYKAHPGEYDSTLKGERQKVANDMAISGAGGKTLIAASKMVNHLTDWAKMFEKLNNVDATVGSTGIGPTQLYNSAKNTLAGQSGQQAQTDAQGQALLVGTEMAKTLVQGGQPAEKSIEEYTKLLGNQLSPNQAQGRIDQFVHLMRGQVEPIGNTYKTAIGKEYNGGHLLSPEAEKNIEYLEAHPIKGSDKWKAMQGSSSAPAGGRPPLDSFGPKR